MKTLAPARLVCLAGLLAVLPLAACQSGGSDSRAIHMVEASGARALAKGETELAEAEYAEVVRRNPTRWQARLQYGRALMANGKPHLAREHLEVAYTLRPKDQDVREALGTAMAQNRDYDGAVRLLKSLAEERKRPSDWIRLGNVAFEARDPDTAETAYLTAARADAGINQEPQMALYDFYTATGREEEAFNRLRMAFFTEPQNRVLQSKIRELGYEPNASFALRPTEQEGTSIQPPAVPLR